MAKIDFNSRVIKTTNYAPPTGVGRFDATYDVQRKDLLVVVRVYCNFMNMQDHEKAPFQEAFRTNAPPAWGSKYKFRCTKEGWGDIEAIPRFKLVFDDDWAKSHFIVNVSPTAFGSDSIGRTDAHIARDAVGYKPKTATLGGLRSASEQVDMSAQIGRSLAAAFPFSVQCALTGGVSSAYTRSQIKTIAKEIARVDANFPVYLKGGGSNGAGNMLAVEQLLRDGGLRGPITRRKRAFKYKNEVVITLKDDIEVAVSQMADKSNFGYEATVIHEFGHMLGLQDEYTCMSNNCSSALQNLNVINATEQAAYESRGYAGAGLAGANAAPGQAAWVNLCMDAKVSPPPFGFHTTSVMSAGRVFHKRHFVTLWDCLGTMCAADVGKTEWAIIEGT